MLLLLLFAYSLTESEPTTRRLRRGIYVRWIDFDAKYTLSHVRVLILTLAARDELAEFGCAKLRLMGNFKETQAKSAPVLFCSPRRRQKTSISIKKLLPSGKSFLF